MKLINTILVLSLFISICEARNINLDTLTSTTGAGTAVYDFSISEARFNSQPAWEPGKQPVPLGIDKAIQIAQAWIEKQSWSKQFEHFDSIKLQKNEDCWYYYIDLDCDDSDHPALHPTGVIILLDGSVVEPKRKSHTDPNF
jgi:hypothetical protein